MFFFLSSFLIFFLFRFLFFLFFHFFPFFSSFFLVGKGVLFGVYLHCGVSHIHFYCSCIMNYLAIVSTINVFPVFSRGKRSAITRSLAHAEKGQRSTIPFLRSYLWQFKMSVRDLKRDSELEELFSFRG